MSILVKYGSCNNGLILLKLGVLGALFVVVVVVACVCVFFNTGRNSFEANARQKCSWQVKFSKYPKNLSECKEHHQCLNLV